MRIDSSVLGLHQGIVVSLERPFEEIGPDCQTEDSYYKVIRPFLLSFRVVVTLACEALKTSLPRLVVMVWYCFDAGARKMPLTVAATYRQHTLLFRYSVQVYVASP
jgi:hypothetical protein